MARYQQQRPPRPPAAGPRTYLLGHTARPLTPPAARLTCSLLPPAAPAICRHRCRGQYHRDGAVPGRAEVCARRHDPRHALPAGVREVRAECALCAVHALQAVVGALLCCVAASRHRLARAHAAAPLHAAPAPQQPSTPTTARPTAPARACVPPASSLPAAARPWCLWCAPSSTRSCPAPAPSPTWLSSWPRHALRCGRAVLALCRGMRGCTCLGACLPHACAAQRVGTGVAPGAAPRA